VGFGGSHAVVDLNAVEIFSTDTRIVTACRLLVLTPRWATNSDHIAYLFVELLEFIVYWFRNYGGRRGFKPVLPRIV
jgi:hypothetical protein